MKPTPYTAILLLAAIILISGCKKTEEPEDNFSLEHYHGSGPLHVDIYPSEQDYINNTNAILHATIQSNSTYTFPTSKLKLDNWYYVDAYNDDYTYTNWAQSDNLNIGQDSTTPRRFKYNGTNKIFVVSCTQTNARNVLLKSTQATSRWKAIDAIDLVDGSDIWFTLTPAQRYQELTFSKTSTGVHTYMIGSSTTSRTFSFKETMPTGYPTFIINPYPTSLHMFVTNTYKNINVSPDDQPPTKDSLLALLNGNLYILERQ